MSNKPKHRTYGYVGTVLILVSTLLGKMLSTMFGHAFVESVYHGESIPLLNLLISGQAQTPLDFYLSKFDRIIDILFILGMLGAAASFIAGYISGWIEHWSVKDRINAFTLLVIVCFACLGLTLGYSYFVLEQFPNSADEYAFLFQADTFTQGRLWNTTHPLQNFFSFIHIAEKEGKWVSRFPPGWPIILFIAGVLRIPAWLVNPFLSSVAIWVLFLLARRLHGEKVGIITAISVLCSSFFVFNGASYFSHTSMLLLMVLFYYHGTLFLEKNSRCHAVFAGIWLGFAFITRYYTAALIGVPFAVYFLLTSSRRAYSRAIWFGLGVAPFLVLILVYNQQITGDPFLLVTKWMDPEEGIGFTKGFTFMRGLQYTRRHFLDFMYWTSPTLLILIFGLIFCVRFEKSWNAVSIFIFLTVVIGYLFYWTAGGNQYGARFYFEAYPFAVLAVVATLFGEGKDTARKGFLRFLFVMGVMWAILIFPKHTIEEHRVIEERMDLYKLVKQEGIRNAIVVLSNGTGVLRPMPIGDLIRNGTDLSGNILFARDLGDEKNMELKKYFPDKGIYRYIRDKNEVRGILEKID
jgi:hypothetical protein